MDVDDIDSEYFGPHYIFSKINATLPKSTAIDDITLDIAIELIKNKKANGYSRKKFKK